VCNLGSKVVALPKINGSEWLAMLAINNDDL
jgi:hypothetical protein